MSNPNYALPEETSFKYVIVEDETLRSISVGSALGIIMLCIAMIVLGRPRK